MKGQTTFDLEAAIASWRAFQAQRRVILKEDLDELESHLREHIGDLCTGGLDARTAFEQALEAMGDFDGGETEYGKVYWGKLRRLRSLKSEFFWRFSMLNNFFKVAFRSLRKQKGYAFINICGLAIGFACAFFILLWVQDELRQDRFLPEGDRIYRVLRNINTSHQMYTAGSLPKPLAGVLESDYPEISQSVITHWPQQFVVTVGDESYREDGNLVSANFFDVFAFPFIQGDPATALRGGSSLVITERTARKLFGDSWTQHDNVIGRTLSIDHQRDLTVAGVIEDIPAYSSMQFDVLLPIEEYFSRNEWVEHWGNNVFVIYVKLKEGAPLAAVNDKISDVIVTHHDTEDIDVFLQPYEDLYLYSDYRNGEIAGGRIEYVRIFSIVAIFLLLIASINFMNLATARSSKRALEIGVRKAIGADRHSLIAQFMGESLLVAFIALAFALGLVGLFSTLFSQVTDKSISLLSLDGSFFIGAFGITLIVGLIAGSYPALYLSSFTPLVVLRGALLRFNGTVWLRRSLVVVQFALSVLLIIATIAVYLQVRFIHEKDLGLDRENVIYLAQEGALLDQYEAVRQALIDSPGIAQVTASTTSPLQIGSSTGDPAWEGKDPNDEHSFFIIEANYDFVETMKMEILEGRSFSRSFGVDSLAYIVNEETAKLIGGDVLGTTISFWGRSGPVIGIVKNFEMNSMYVPIEPVIIRMNPSETETLYIRTEPGLTGQAIASLQTVFDAFNQGYPFDYGFLDQDFEKTYRSEVILGMLANIFACIAIFISCLGLFGLVSFSAEQRTKEIGIRKVLGATVTNLVRLQTTEITKLVIAGIAIAIPVAYYVVHRWLEHFEYKIDLGPGIFIVAGLSAVAIAWLTVSYLSIKTAMANPVTSLRYE